MSGEHESEESNETGAGLRSRLEAEIARANQAEQALRATVAGGFQHVKPEDLAGVPHGELTAKAAEIENARKAEQETLVQQALKSRGLTDEQITALLTAEGQPAQTSEASQGAPAFLGNLNAAPPSRTEDFAGLVGPARIRAATAARK